MRGPTAPFVPERLGDQSDEDRQRAEHEGDGRGRREAHGVDEGELVQPDSCGCRQAHEEHVSAADDEAAFARVREAGEEERADRKPHGRVRQRLPAVRERVLHHGEVEAPKHDRDEQEYVGRDALAHGRRLCKVPCPKWTIDRLLSRPHR